MVSAAKRRREALTGPSTATQCRSEGRRCPVARGGRGSLLTSKPGSFLDSAEAQLNSARQVAQGRPFALEDGLGEVAPTPGGRDPGSASSFSRTRASCRCNDDSSSRNPSAMDSTRHNTALQLVDDLIADGKMHFTFNEAVPRVGRSPTATANLLRRMVATGLVDRVSRGPLRGPPARPARNPRRCRGICTPHRRDREPNRRKCRCRWRSSLKV
jgi:hypothetical protein